MSTQKIQFFFQPYQYENGLHLIEKDSGSGFKRKYFNGVSSGIQIDGHGERITEKCIKSFQDQTNSGDILMYAYPHGIKGGEDIGILCKSEILPNNDWYIESRLYDEHDNLGALTTERSRKMWSQANGLPPYKKKKQFGFSIEGYIPDEGIISMSSDGRRVIDDVKLDGIIIVPRPAYQTSIAHAIYKALNEPAPWTDLNQQQIRKSLHDKLNEKDIKDSFYKKQYALQDALDESISNIMSDVTIEDKRERLIMLFDEFKIMMTDLIISNENLFQENLEQNSGSLDEVLNIYRSKNDDIMILKSLCLELDKLEKNLIEV